MIKTIEIKVKVANSNVCHYNSKGYKCKPNDIIDVKVEDLSKQSTVKVAVICDICYKEKIIEYRKYINNIKNKNFYVCSLSCAQSKIKLTKKENYGDCNFSNIEKREKTCIEKYNDKNYKNIKKMKDTNIKKYNFEYPIQNDDVKEKRKKTNIDKFGVDSPIKNTEIKEKRNETLLLRYGDKNFNNIKKTLDTIKNSNINKLSLNFNLDVIDYDNQLFTIKCEKNHNFKISYDLIYKRNLYNTTICTVCNPIGSLYSDSEKKVLDYIKENYNGKIIINNRITIQPYELDIYLPDLNLAFEYNGLFWHSEFYRDKKYHRMKFKMCEEKNIQLIQIMEDDWIYKQDIVKSMILNKLNKITNKIFARKCVIKQVFEKNIIKNFLNQNHIQGYTASTIKLGLFFNDKLVSLMTFIKKDNNYELNRYCNILNTVIIGSASKLFSYFIKNYIFDNIISFSNNFYSNGNLYFILNFRKLLELREDYSYIVNGKRCHKFNFRKNKDEKNTERNIMLNKNYLRLYDAGKIKFIYP